MAGSDHDYADCDDTWCDRYPCRIYREGLERGFSQGYQAGEADGYANGCAHSSPELAG